MRINFTLNGERVSCDVNPKRKLSLLLHDTFGVRSVKISCRTGMCGSCTVLMEDEAVPSCLIPAFGVQEKSVLTFEGLKELPDYTDIMKSFEHNKYFPCEYCLPSKALTIYALLLQNPHPREDEIIDAMRGNICSCDVSGPLINSVFMAARLKREGSYGR